MNDALKQAEDTLAALHRGDYDQQLGIPTEQTQLVTKARDGYPLTLDDIRQLAAINRHDLIDAARINGNIQTTNPGDNA